MITLVEARGFRCLELLRQPLGPFQVLAGPSGSGKSTFLDILSFLGALTARGPALAATERAPTLDDLSFQRRAQPIELAIEATVPEPIRRRLGNPSFETLRYEVGLERDPETGEPALTEERVSLKASEHGIAKQLEMFPGASGTQGTILTSKSVGVARTIVHKVQGGNDNYYSETYQEPGKGWLVAYRLGRRRSALAYLPEDETRFPASLWFKRFLAEQVHHLAPDVRLLRKPSPPGQPSTYRTDGSNLPWLVATLEQQHPESVSRWLTHLKAALPDITEIRSVQRPDDCHRHLVLRTQSGLDVPSWSMSDGVLRLLALTLPAFLPGSSGLWLVEEPEVGLHPRAAQAALGALAILASPAFLPTAQVLVTTHAPAVITATDPGHILCFSRREDGATTVTSGREKLDPAAWHEAALR
ncbi:AAA family ATPase [Chondromyces apiculatus]|uniref:ATPase AAA-type core domain-containing protein n=1 Tax=Chondromyces apiculatus DSM 436 TaxID=1192034 RepID=A0A017STS1_9BACT|nr:AAA family ATPase [Chondromyces apiculatus]EYF00388.1 Hypothetical protein CAP_0872 [Chondromyces apiculatus DSM 436]